MYCHSTYHSSNKTDCNLHEGKASGYRVNGTKHVCYLFTSACKFWFKAKFHRNSTCIWVFGSIHVRLIGYSLCMVNMFWLCSYCVLIGQFLSLVPRPPPFLFFSLCSVKYMKVEEGWKMREAWEHLSHEWRLVDVGGGECCPFTNLKDRTSFLPVKRVHSRSCECLGSWLSLECLMMKSSTLFEHGLPPTPPYITL